MGVAWVPKVKQPKGYTMRHATCHLDRGVLPGIAPAYNGNMVSPLAAFAPFACAALLGALLLARARKLAAKAKKQRLV
jgi:hypothetical protein